MGHWRPLEPVIWAGELCLVVLLHYHHHFRDWNLLAGALSVIRHWGPSLQLNGAAPCLITAQELSKQYHELEQGSRVPKHREPSNRDILDYWGRKHQYDPDKAHRKEFFIKRHGSLWCFRRAVNQFLARYAAYHLGLSNDFVSVYIDDQGPWRDTHMLDTTPSISTQQAIRSEATRAWGTSFLFTKAEITMIFALLHLGYKGHKIEIPHIVDSLNRLSAADRFSPHRLVDGQGADTGNVHLMTSYDVKQLEKDFSKMHPQRIVWAHGPPWWQHPQGELYSKILENYDFGLWCHRNDVDLRLPERYSTEGHHRNNL
ncbi:MAG: hypothetical protein Q9183_005349 [Haloplaca sp. 2 TL-2023]